MVTDPFIIVNILLKIELNILGILFGDRISGFRYPICIFTDTQTLCH